MLRADRRAISDKEFIIYISGQVFFKINNSCAKLLSILLHMKYKLSQKPQLKKFIYLIAYDSSPMWVHTEIIYKPVKIEMGFPDRSAGKETTCNAGDPGLIPGLGRLPWRRNRLPAPVFLGFPGGSDCKESACNVGDLGSIPGLGRFPGGGHDNQLQCS